MLDVGQGDSNFLQVVRHVQVTVIDLDPLQNAKYLTEDNTADQKECVTPGSPPCKWFSRYRIEIRQLADIQNGIDDKRADPKCWKDEFPKRRRGC